MERITKITGKSPVFVKGDVLDAALLQKLFSGNAIDSVIHFAGLKSVAEGGVKPLLLYDNNVVGSVTLFEQMAKANVHSLVFSSSATVYGESVFFALYRSASALAHECAWPYQAHGLTGFA